MDGMAFYKEFLNQTYDATAIYQYNIELTADQQAALAGAETFYLSSTVGVASGKAESSAR